MKYIIFSSLLFIIYCYFIIDYVCRNEEGANFDKSGYGGVVGLNFIWCILRYLKQRGGGGV